MLDLMISTSTLQALEAVGFQAPKAARPLLDALKAVPGADALRAEAADALRAALLAGDSAAIRAATVAAAALNDGQVVGGAIGAARDKLIAEALRAVAPDAFTFARTRYDEAGRALMDALAACDALAGPDDLPGMTPDQVQAWGSLGSLRADVDASAALLSDVLYDVCRRPWRDDPAHQAQLYVVGGDPQLVLEAFAWRPPTGREPIKNLGRDVLSRLCASRGGVWSALVVLAQAELRCPLATAADYAP